MVFPQGASSEHYYSPLDEATISYVQLLEKVSLIVNLSQLVT